MFKFVLRGGGYVSKLRATLLGQKRVIVLLET